MSSPLCETVSNKLCGWPPHYASARDLDFLPFDLEVGVVVSCVLGYPCAKFRLPMVIEPMYATSDGGTDDGRRSPLNALLGGGIITKKIRIN